MGDWRELEVGLELDRIVAETLGWTGLRGHYGASWWGHSPETGLLVACPHWSVDANAALDLVKRLRCTIESVDGAWTLYDDTGILSARDGDTFCLAVCRAWLTVHDPAQQPLF